MVGDKTWQKKRLHFIFWHGYCAVHHLKGVWHQQEEHTVLLDAPYFNVTEQLPQDLMHVILEGSLSRTLYFVVPYFLNNICSLNEINTF